MSRVRTSRRVFGTTGRLNAIHEESRGVLEREARGKKKREGERDKKRVGSEGRRLKSG